VGGDFFDFLLLDEDHLAFAVGDVSGKGVPAAIFMAMTQTLLRGAARQRLAPGECLDHVNQTLAPQNTRAMFVTLFYGVLNFRTGELRFANGGHDTPYVFSPSGGVRPLPSQSRSLVVGVLDEAVYATESCVLAPGEALLVTTDGVTEAMDPQDQLFGSERVERFLCERVAEPAPRIVSDLLESLARFADTAPQSDDITILTLRRIP
jgi:sigma-B regulation protein RsbU (phosphoserine phosphatase)